MSETIFDTIRSRAGRMMEWVGRDLARQGLLRMSDRALADMGFSRERLEAGVRAWPWRAEDDTAETIAAIRAAGARRRAAPDATDDPVGHAQGLRADLGDARGRAPIASGEGHDATEERLAA